ncbi:MAG: rhombosortase [Woeseiaceae bacterium]
MGLVNRREPGLISGIKQATYWHFAGVLIIASLLVGALGDKGRELLKYDRLAIADGEVWRFVTANFAHLSNSHLLLNMLGLFLTWLLVGRYFSAVQWILITVGAVIFQSAGFWFLDSNMLWYVGMSGLLHGLMLAGALKGIETLRTESLILCGLVIAKLVYEQFLGPLPGSESTSGGTVVVNAHLYGAVGGAIAAFILRHRARP